MDYVTEKELAEIEAKWLGQHPVVKQIIETLREANRLLRKAQDEIVPYAGHGDEALNAIDAYLRAIK